jgi:hypothetical protein
VIEDR